MEVQKKWIEIALKKDQEEYVIQQYGHTKQILGRYFKRSDDYEWEVFDLSSDSLDPIESGTVESKEEARKKIEQYWSSVKF